MDFDAYLSMLDPEVRQQVSAFYGPSGQESAQPPAMALPPQAQQAASMGYQGPTGFQQGPTGGVFGRLMDEVNGYNPFNPNRSYGSSSNPYANINPNRYNNLDRDENPGDKLYADLIRAQTEDYNQRFAPLERFMADQITATGTKSLAGDLMRTRQNIGTAVGTAQGQSNRDMARMGLQNTGNIANSTSAVGGLVGGLNDTRLRDADRRQSILSGSLSGISQKARSTGQ